MDIDINRLMKSIEKAELVKKEERKKEKNINKLIKKAQRKRC